VSQAKIKTALHSQHQPDFRLVLRTRLRELRELRQKTRKQFALDMCKLGFKWSHDHAVSVERGHSNIQFAEILGFAHILKAAWADFLRMPGGCTWLTPGWSMPGDDSTINSVLMLKAGWWRSTEVIPTVPVPVFVTECGRAVIEKLSERLGRKVTSHELTEASNSLWGQSFMEERDSIAQRPGATMRQLQAYRAHATRGLLDELQEALTHHAPQR